MLPSRAHLDAWGAAPHPGRAIFDVDVDGRGVRQRVTAAVQRPLGETLVTTETTPMVDRRAHSLRPLLLDAADAHARGWVRYESDTSAVVECDELTRISGRPSMRFGPERQY